MTTGELAKKYAEYVSYVTIGNWVRNGKLKAKKTAGGHYRVEENDFRLLLGIEESEI